MKPRPRRAKKADLVSAYGLTDTSLLRLLEGGFGRSNVNPGTVVDFFLTARSREEARAADDLPALIEQETGGEIVFAGYEWVSFKLPGSSYTPDWNYLLSDGRWVRVEVKGSRYQAGYQASVARLRAAAALNPWDAFYLYEAGRPLRRVDVDGDWLATLLLAARQWINYGSQKKENKKNE